MPTKSRRTAEAVPDVFAAAQRRQAPEAASGAVPKRGGTTLRIPDRAPNEVHDAVRAYRASSVQIKSATAQRDAAEEALKPIAEQLFAQAWQAAGGRPAGPIEIESRDGQQVTFVLTDRTKGFAVSDELHAELADLVEEPALAELVETCDVYTLNQEVLEEPGVKAAISAAIAKAKLTAEQRSRLLTHARVTRFKAACLNDLAAACAPGKLPELLALLRSAAPRYLKA